MLKDSRIKTMLVFALACSLFLVLSGMSSYVGVSAKNIENDIRVSQKINDDWVVEGSVGENMAAYISYPENRSTYTYSLYLNYPGFSFGYFFRSGGAIPLMDDSLALFEYDEYDEEAYISMNNQKVDRIEIGMGHDIQVIDIDSDKPFAIVLKKNQGRVQFYDVNNQLVEYTQAN